MGFYAPAGSVLPLACPGWGFCPGRADDTENAVPGSIPTVVAQGKKVSLITESEAAQTNVTTLDLPLELELEDEAAFNRTAVRLHVASLLGIPMEAVALSRDSTTRRRLGVLVHFTIRIDQAYASDVDARIGELWSTIEADDARGDGADEGGSGTSDEGSGGSGGDDYPLFASLLSEALGSQVNISRATAPVEVSRIVTLNQTVTRLAIVDCGAGFWGANGKCIPCSKGTFKPAGSDATECLPCAAGTYQPDIQAVECLPCLAGHYCAEGSAAALPCPGGTRVNKSIEVMTREEDCIVCPVGYSCSVGSEEAVLCSAGTYGDVERLERCFSCEAGKFADVEGATACKQCLAGAFCPRGASIALPCEAGSYSNLTNISLASQCEPCPMGHACATGSLAPAPCTPGSIAPTSRSSVCTPCSPGTYQPDSGGLQCLMCGAGNYSASILSCEPCSSCFETSSSALFEDTAPSARLVAPGSMPLLERSPSAA